MTTPFAKVYYDHDPRFVIGPLGYWAVGDEVILPGGDGDSVIVTSLDVDGSAVAHRREHIDRICFDQDCSLQTALNMLSQLRTGNTGILTPAQQEQCEQLAAAGVRQRLEDEKRAMA